MAGPLTTMSVSGDEAGARQFMALLGELCLRALGISLAIAGVITAYLAIAGGTIWASTPWRGFLGVPVSVLVVVYLISHVAC